RGQAPKAELELDGNRLRRNLAGVQRLPLVGEYANTHKPLRRGSLAGLFSLGVLLALCALGARASSSDAKSWRQLIEADWLAYEETLMATNHMGPLPYEDAAGGCDGVKDGGPGFHTEKQSQPWWQVDLGTSQPVARVVIWNRTECAERASRLHLSLSDDGRSWTTVYHHDGTTFYGF